MDTQNEIIVGNIREIAKKRNTTLKKLEVDLGFGNGTIGKWAKASKSPTYDKLHAIATALCVSVDDLLSKETKKAPTEDGERSENGDILDEVDVAFYGDYKQLTEENKETLRAMARLFRERQGKQE